MKGLLIKDFKLLKNMRSSMVMVVLIAVLMSTYLSDISFIIMYLSLLGASFTMSTLSYDEYDNGYAFLMSLPITRKGYVAEKYGFGLIMCMGAWFLGAAIVMVVGLVKKTASVPEVVMLAFTLLPAALLLLAVMLPLRLKFGAEKGRIVMIAAMGLVFGFAYLAVKLAQTFKWDMDAVGERLGTLGMGAEIVLSIGIAVLLLLLSFKICLSIMKKKEF